MCFYKLVFKNMGASLSWVRLDGTDTVYGAGINIFWLMLQVVVL